MVKWKQNLSFARSIPQINLHWQNKLDWIKTAALTAVTKCMSHMHGILWVGKGARLPWNLQKFWCPLEMNWSSWRKTNNFMFTQSSLLSIVQENLTTNFYFLKCLEHTAAKKLMNSKSCTCFYAQNEVKTTKTCTKYCESCVFDGVQLISRNVIMKRNRPRPFWPAQQLGHVSIGIFRVFKNS